MEDLAAVIALNELVDSDDEKPTRGKTRKWIRRRKERGYFTNIIQELIVEDRHGFQEIFRMDVRDFEFILSKISDLISPKERLAGTRSIESYERLALTLRYLATGESFQSLSFQYRISMSTISYIVKGCCKAVVERLTPDLIKVSATKAEWHNVSKRFEDRWNYPHKMFQKKNIPWSKKRSKETFENFKVAQHTWKMIKCWMKFDSNASNMKFILDE